MTTWPVIQCDVAYQTPPQCISIGRKHLIVLLLSQIHKEGGQDQTQEANVPSCDQLLPRANTTQTHAYKKYSKKQSQRNMNALLCYFIP